MRTPAPPRGAPLALIFCACVGQNPYYVAPPEATEGETSSPSTSPETTIGVESSTDPTDPTSGASTVSSTGGVCGDGTVDVGEECDEGPNNGTPQSPCSLLCTLDPTGCGDGILDDSEECDDGNNTDGDGCSSQCKNEGPQGLCGDGIVDGAEECDDGNQDDNDACLSSCELATCGDGILYDGVEECDDGNNVDEDTCDNACESICGDGCIVVVSEGTGEAKIFEPENYNIVAVYPLFEAPTSVAVGPGPKLYVGESNSLVSLDLATEEVTFIALLGGAEPHGLTVHEGYIYASGKFVDKIRVLTLDGDLVDILGSPNGASLRGNTFGPMGHFYVASLSDSPAQLWEPGLLYKGPFGKDYVVQGSAIATRQNGDVLLADIEGSKYSVFGPLGEFKKTVAVACTHDLYNMATDPTGRLYVACYGDEYVNVHGANDEPLGKIKVETPSDVAVLPKF